MAPLFAQANGTNPRRTDRRAPRRHELRDAKLVYVENQSGAIIDCQLKDISEFGAGIEMANTHDVPAHVILKIADGTLYDAEVVWRTDHRLGLRFAALQRRRAPRRRQLRTGQLLINDASRAINCRIRDISQSGAGLECEAAKHVPTNVILKASDGKLYEGEVAWQNDKHLGLRFLHHQQLNELIDELNGLRHSLAEDMETVEEICEKYHNRKYSTHLHPRIATHLRKLADRADDYKNALDDMLHEFGPD